ncbi:initiation factor 2 subunit family protein [Stagonosporopsis vannaccii]|nr:initiation factor 2 subunit family protein [Stagonosporopsis vannaccii]
MSANSEFDIVSSYRRILNEDPELTMPVAAIEALVEAIAQSSVSTVAETLELLERHTAALKASIANPISLSAGTDLFQRYLITTLNRPASLNLGPDDDFRAIRNHLLSNGKLFVERAKQSREKIASFGKHFIRDGATVLTNGGSRVVGALLRRAAESSTIRFRVVYVVPSSRSSDANEGDQTVADLRAHNVPVATITDSAVAYSLGKVDMVIVGAEGVVENGGIISRMGTYQMGLLAKSKGKPFYVVAESHKFVRLYPLSQFDLPIEQKVLDFKITDEPKTSKTGGKDAVDEGIADMALKQTLTGLNAQDAVDFTPPDLISGIITESGVLTPSAVSEELIKICKTRSSTEEKSRAWDGDALDQPQMLRLRSHNNMSTRGEGNIYIALTRKSFGNAHAAFFLSCDPRSAASVAMMQKGSPPKKFKLVPRTEPRSARRTTPSLYSDDHGLDWTEFLSHGHFDHDATVCSFCISNRPDQTLTTPVASPSAKQKVRSFRRQAANYLSETWSRRSLTLAKALRTRRAGGNVGGEIVFQGGEWRAVADPVELNGFEVLGGSECIREWEIRLSQVPSADL